MKMQLLYIYIVIWPTAVVGDPKAPFSIATTPRYLGRRYSFPSIAQFTLDPYLMMLSVKQGSIKHQFFQFLVWLDLAFNPDLPGHCRKLTIMTVGLYIYMISISAQSARAIEILTASLLRGKIPTPMSTLDMTLNYQIGARGVMVIATGYGHGDTSSIPGQDWLHFT